MFALELPHVDGAREAKARPQLLLRARIPVVLRPPKSRCVSSRGETQADRLRLHARAGITAHLVAHELEEQRAGQLAQHDPPAGVLLRLAGVAAVPALQRRLLKSESFEV